MDASLRQPLTVAQPLHPPLMPCHGPTWRLRGRLSGYVPARAAGFGLLPHTAVVSVGKDYQGVSTPGAVDDISVFRSQAERQQMTECRIPTCTRLASIRHRTCCSACSPTLGQEHTARCDWLLSQGNVASNSQLPASNSSSIQPVVTAWMT